MMNNILESGRYDDIKAFTVSNRKFTPEDHSRRELEETLLREFYHNPKLRLDKITSDERLIARVLSNYDWIKRAEELAEIMKENESL